jgi:threonine synthase
VITGEGLKTLDAVRGTFEAHEIDADVESFDSTVPAPAAV